MSRNVCVALLLASIPLSAVADVHWNGLYHNNTNLTATIEAVPGLSGVDFLNIDYADTNVTVYFLTDSPGGNPGETVTAKVRLYSNQEYWQDATKMTTVVLQSGVNPFHNTPASGAVTVDVWKATWLPTRQFNGTVYYSCQILTASNGAQTDFRFLLKSLVTNNTGSAVGTNSSFWVTNPQLIGTNEFNVDYSFSWTNAIPYDFGWVYFNNTNAALPQAESVPGLPGHTFLEYNYASNVPSYAYVLTPNTGIVSMTLRTYYGGGPGEVFQTGSFYTNVVISSTNQFHGVPAAGDVTVSVWRAAFYPPSGWSNDLYVAPQITKAGDGTMWLVNNLNSIPNGFTATNNFVSNPQYFYSEGSATRDWLYQPTATIIRASVNLDWAYGGSTNLNPRLEPIPGYGNHTFLEVNYPTTTTTFYVLSDSSVNLVPGETGQVYMRTSWFNPETTNWDGSFPQMTLVTNLVLDSGAPFHGLPVVGTHTVALWKTDWQQPTSSGGVAFTNDITIFYSPFMKTLAGPGNFQTDYRYLTKRIDGATNYWGYNNYPVSPQYYGTDPTGNHDYRYENNPVNLDWFYFNNTNAVAQPQDEPVPGLPGRKFFEYNYGTNQLCYVHVLVPTSGVQQMQVRFWFNNGGGEVYYNASWLSNVVIDSGSPFHGLPTSGAVTVGVYEAAFYPPPNWLDDMYFAPRITLANGTTLFMVRNIDGDLYSQFEVNNWTANPQLFFTDYGNRDWYFRPTSQVQRAGVSFTTDWAYHGNTNSFNPDTELIPGFGGATFRNISYATTTTVIYIMTEKSFGLLEGESATMDLRVAWSTNGTSGWTEEFMPFAWITNLVLDSGAKFHGLPLAGKHTVDLWQANWRQPLDIGGQPLTNDVHVFYAPRMQSVLGNQSYTTEVTWVVAALTNAADGSSNNYPVAPQFFGSSPINQDYFYLHHWTPGGLVDGIPLSWWQKYGLAVTNKAAADNDGDGYNNMEEYLADTSPTNPASYFQNPTNLAGTGVMQISIPQTSTGRVYDAFFKANLIPEGADWIAEGLNTTGSGSSITLTVTNIGTKGFYRTGVRLP